jgi:hypothetical protein
LREVDTPRAYCGKFSGRRRVGAPYSDGISRATFVEIVDELTDLGIVSSSFEDLAGA